MTGAFSTRDGAGIVLFVGTFLAGAGAIAGAVIGGVAELLVFFQRREQARQSQGKCESKSNV